MTISVILAVYNEEKYLEKCINSLAKQQNVSFEVIIIDDGSHRPVDISKLNLPNSTFTLIRINHSGPAIARNTGVEKAQGEIVVFVDGDMEFAPNFLEKLTMPIIEEKSKGTFSTEELVANWDNIWARCWNYENGLSTNRRIKAASNMSRDFRAILKSEFTKVNGFDNTGYTDTWTLGKKLGYYPTPTQANYFHYNPSSRNEVFMHALWIGGRQRKFGIFGQITAALRATMPCSLIMGLFKAALYRQSHMINFKFIYDLGILGGIMNSMVNGKNLSQKL